MKIQKTFKYRIYPKSKQIIKLNKSMLICKEIYNLLISENKKYQFTNKHQFCNIISDLKCIDKKHYSTVHSQVLQNVADRVEKAYNNFFSRIKLRKQGNKIKTGYPRFKSEIKSITYPQTGFSIQNNKLKLSKIGDVPIILHRDIQGKIKTLTIKKNKSNQWFAYFTTEHEIADNIKHPSIKECGIDVGLERFATISDNQGIIDNPRFYRKQETKIRREQRKLSHKKKGSSNYKKQKIILARMHLKVDNQRTDFLHKITSTLSKEYKTIKLEKLNIQNMLKNHKLAKSISDAGWYKFKQFLSYKEVILGGQMINVIARNTSQKCSVCGNLNKMQLKDRIYNCSFCGHVEHRDNNASNNIKNDTVGQTEIHTLVETSPLVLRLAKLSEVNESRTICQDISNIS